MSEPIQAPGQPFLAQTTEEARIESNQRIRDSIIGALAKPENFNNPDAVSLLCGVLNDSDRTSLGMMKNKVDSQSNANNAAMLDTFARIAGGNGPRTIPSQVRTSPTTLAQDVVPTNVVPGETSHEDGDNYQNFATRMGLPTMAKKQ